MRTFSFNKIYVIESLPEGHRRTGKELYDDLLRYQELKYPLLKVVPCWIKSKSEWDTLMNQIAEDCEQNGSHAILHLEIHGECHGQGLVMGNGDFLTYDYIRPQLERINIASHCNLFLTLAVCKGLYITSINRLSKPMPFCGILGSIDDIYEHDIVIRFNEFYDEFFTSFELAKAYKRLQEANPDLPSTYRFDHADMLFCREYQRYINNKCNKDVIKERALEAAKDDRLLLPTRQLRRKFQRDFEAQEKKTREMYFLDAARNFFMLDDFPENKERFEVPSNLKELEEKAASLL